MKTQHTLKLALTYLLLLGLTPKTPAAIDDANTVISVQGQLVPCYCPQDPGWTRHYDITFALFNTNNGGAPIVGPVTNMAVLVDTNSRLFTTFANFGSNVDNTHSYWMEISVRTNGGNAFTTLSPRQTVTPAPQAYYASSAGVASVAMMATNFVGTVSGDVSGTQGATVVTSVGGQTSASIASATVAANSATSAGTASTIVARDGSGSFSAGSVTLGGSLYLPFPAVIYSGTNTVFVEEGSLFVGGNAYFPPNYYSTTGSGASAQAHDVGIGDSVLSSGSSGPFNTAIGELSLQYDTTGSNNTAGGFGALRNNTTGSNNKADGYQSLYSNTTGGENTANGSQALYSNKTGGYNDAYGYQTLFSATNVNFNSGFGSYALRANTSGSQNAAFGFEALYANISGIENTAVGIEALWSNTVGSYNTANGFQALYYNIASYNTANGFQALVNNTTGSQNTANGYESLYHNTTGPNNTAVGSQALFNNTGAIGNTAVGYQALYANTTGYYNEAVGANALAANTTGIGNEANGGNTLTSNTTGGYNSANGGAALYNNTTGSDNTANGFYTLYYNTTGGNNTANGERALLNNTTGSFNTADGMYALDNSTGNYNIAVGYLAGHGLVTGTNDIYIGNQGTGGNFSAGENNTIRIGTTNVHNNAYVAGIWGTTLAASNRFVVVDGTGHLGASVTSGGGGVTSVTGSQHITASPTTGAVVVGSDATPLDTFGTIVSRDANGSFNANNIALGSANNGTFQNGVLNLPATTYFAGIITMGSTSNLFIHAYGSNNFFGGLNAGNLTLTGGDNTGLGFKSLYQNTSGYVNTAVGSQSLFSNADGFGNTAIGYQALYSNTSGYDNVASGWQTLLSNTTGWYNTADGIWALRNNTTGDDNTASGYNALGNNTTGTQNTADGVHALHGSTSGSQNVAVGWWSMNNFLSGTNNIGVGYQAGINLTSGNNSIYIGNQGAGENFNSGESDTIRIGSINLATTNTGPANTYIAGIYDNVNYVGTPLQVYVDAGGHLGVLGSSERFKQNVQNMKDASDVLLSLRPVKYEYKPGIDPKASPQFGLIAEEVDKVDPDLVVHDERHGIYTVRYEAVNAMLLNEFLKQHQKVEAQNTEIESLKEKAAQVDSLASRLDELQALVKQLAAQK